MTETAAADVAVSFRNVAKTFSGRGFLTAIADLSFDIGRGDYVCIVGRTGCGKSTTINLLLGIEKPSAGSISVLGLDPFGQFNALRGQIGCVFQSDRLLPWRSAIDDVRVPIEIIGKRESDLNENPRQLLQRLGLGGFEHAYPHELSGGMRQRVGLARALASDPAILLADEAFGHLDEVTGAALRTEFRQLSKDRGKTVLHVTHSIDEAITLSDRILVFGRPGHVAADLKIDGNDRGPQRETLRRTIFQAIEASDRRQPSNGTADGIAA
jgi:NitT/TauT family transport system ATP-binding protein